MSSPFEVIVPREIVNADSVYVVSWAADDGARVELGQGLCDIETSKAVVTVEADSVGYLRRVADVGAEVAIGGTLAYITETPDAALPSASAAATTAPSAAGAATFSAKARRKLTELGLDEALFTGHGMVREEDVVAMAAKQRASTQREDPRGPARSMPLAAIQRRVAKVMEHSIAAIPAAYLERQIDLGPVRARAQKLSAENKAVVSEVDLLVAAVAKAAAAHPNFNGYLTSDYHLTSFELVNVGVAVDVDGDLFVVVVRDAANKADAAIAKELRGLQYLAARRRLSAEQLTGGTITVTSMLGRGVQHFQPIPYPEQAAIIGLADVQPGTAIASLALVFDHRVANGSAAAAFLGAIADALVG